jgi:AraC-like DNA-binding protein
MRSPAKIPAGGHNSAGWDIATPWHYHDMHQLLYAFDGAVEVEGVHGCYKVPRQFAVWIPAGAIHRTTIQKVASGSVFLSPDMLPCTMTAPRVIAAPALLREMVLYAMRWPLERERDAISDSYFSCFAQLCAGWIEAEKKLLLPTSGEARITAATAYCAAHAATVMLDDVCRHVNMSARTLRRHFRHAVGMSWEEYRLRLRISLALEALDGSDKRIGQIAAEVGYENQAAFARAFRAVTGKGPKEYRQSGH